MLNLRMKQSRNPSNRSHRPDPLTEEEITQLETLLLDETEWYGLVLSGDFETPEDVPVEFMFGNGPPGSPTAELTESERSFLLEHWSEHSLMMDINRTSRTEYLYALEKYLGLSQETALSLDLGGLLYMPETDSYYSDQNSAVWVYPAIYVAYLRSDGTISVYYKDAFEDYGLSTEYDSIAVLQPREDGYVVLSNDRHIYWND